MSKLQEKSIKILNERYPYHNFNDEQDLELQQFTAEDMVEFALYVAEASLEKASENTIHLLETYNAEHSEIRLEITDSKNIILL